MRIAVNVLVVVIGAVGRAVPDPNDGLEWVVLLVHGVDNQLDFRAFVQSQGFLGLENTVFVGGLDGLGHRFFSKKPESQLQ
jgi:hypothetical protein